MPTTVLDAADNQSVALIAAGRLSAAVSAARSYLAGAPATVALVLVLVAMWFVERAVAGPHGKGSIGYLAMGALPNADIAGRGNPEQLWRIVASGLVHNRTTPLHVGVNALALLMAGAAIERYDRLLMLGTLCLGVMAGGAIWLTASALDLAPEPDYTIGLSAGICALVGMLLVYGYRDRHRLGVDAQRMRALAAIGISLMVVLGLLVPNLNNIAHAGGLASGVLVALFTPMSAWGGGRALGWQRRAFFWLVLLASAASVAFATQNLIGRLLAAS